MALSLLCIGSNLGERELYISSALQSLKLLPNTSIMKRSSIIETDPLEFSNQPSFLNMVILLDTFLEPITLLNKLQEIEKKIGRIFRFSKGPREIDLDILTYNNLQISTERLTLPHPAIITRPFVQKLILEIEEIKLIEPYLCQTL